jgi:hypothetical protein
MNTSRWKFGKSEVSTDTPERVRPFSLYQLDPVMKSTKKGTPVSRVQRIPSVSRKTKLYSLSRIRVPIFQCRGVNH